MIGRFTQRMIGLFCILFTQIAMAGGSGQRVAFNELRDLFYASSAPTVNRLPIDGDYLCTGRIAQAGSMGGNTTREMVRVSTQENLVIMDYVDFDRTFYFEFHGRKLIEDFSPNRGADGTTSRESMRIADDGSLIIEMSVEPDSASFGQILERYYEASSDIQNAYVAGYKKCVARGLGAMKPRGRPEYISSLYSCDCTLGFAVLGSVTGQSSTDFNALCSGRWPASYPVNCKSIH